MDVESYSHLGVIRPEEIWKKAQKYDKSSTINELNKIRFKMFAKKLGLYCIGHQDC